MKILVYVLAFALLISACSKEDDPQLPNFDYEIPDVPITENVNVGAFYYNYSADDWAKKYTYTPLKGVYSALAPDIMEQHRIWADQAGLDFFIFNWNGPVSGDPLLNSFINGRNSKVKMVVNYNTAHLSASSAAPLTGTKLTTMIDEFKLLASTHFNKEYYYKIDGRVVVLFSPLNISANASSSIDFSAVIPALRQAMNEVGVDLYIIGDINSGWLPPQRYAANIKTMDAIDLNNWSTDNYDRSVFFPSFSDLNWKNWKDSTSTWSVDFVPCVFPGFNDKVMSPTSKLYTLERSEQFYTDYCNVAKRNMGSKRIVLVNSWNNFQVGTSLEPAQEYGTTYLDITREQFKVGN